MKIVVALLCQRGLQLSVTTFNNTHLIVKQHIQLNSFIYALDLFNNNKYIIETKLRK